VQSEQKFKIKKLKYITIERKAGSLQSGD
jgi:hypothetical protein